MEWFLYDNCLRHGRVKGLKVDFAMHGFDIRSLPSSVLCVEDKLPRKEKKKTIQRQENNISIV